MGDTELPRNGTLWRLDRLEREVEELKRGQPAVIAERVNRMAEDVRDLRNAMRNELEEMRREIREGDRANSEELGTQRKILISAWVTIGTGLVLAYVLGGGGVPG